MEQSAFGVYRELVHDIKSFGGLVGLRVARSPSVTSDSGTILGLFPVLHFLLEVLDVTF